MRFCLIFLFDLFQQKEKNLLPFCCPMATKQLK
nr:MAG TPA: hypothetical protein [Caudoviricetes sp.]